ncbi:MAG TPA: hypothetical protein VI756_03965, partial [Blastocatellia bacterium]
ATPDITRVDAGDFNISVPGTYQIQFQVSASAAGQLVVALNTGSGAVEQSNTVVGLSGTGDQVSETCIVTTTSANTILSIHNPAASTAVFDIAKSAGGNAGTSGHLVIFRISQPV